MSNLYSILRKKAISNGDELLFAEIPGKVDYSNYEKCLGFTYSEFLNLVDIYIEALKNIPMVTNILFVDNTVASNAMIIAMREVGKKPILIDTSSRQILNDIPAPYIYFKNEFDRGVVDSYVENVITKNIDPDIKGDIIICSSGSEGIPHFNGFTEEELLNMKNQYGLDNSTFYSYISSANISGLLTNIINPLVHNTKAIMRTRFDLAVFDTNRKNEKIVFEEFLLSKRNPDLVEKLFYDNWNDKVVKIVNNKLLIGKIINQVLKNPIYDKLNLKIGSLKELGLSIDEMMLPRDIITHLDNYDCSTLNLSSLKRIYLAGGVNSKATIRTLREKIPTINDNILINLYGATEAGGVISKCHEDAFKPCYIDASNCLKGEIIYTFDKINYFKISNGIVSKTNASFNEETFISFLPVSNDKISNVKIKDNFSIVFLDAIGKNEIESTDIGAFINNQLYIFGRKSSLVTIDNNSYFLSSLEEYISHELNVDTYCMLTSDNHIAIFLNCGNKDLNYKLEIYDKALKFCNKFKKLQFNYPVILDEDSFPKIEISGKISRAQFNKYRAFSGQQHLNFKLREYEKKEIFNQIVNIYLTNYHIKFLDEYTIKIMLDQNRQYFFDLVVAQKLFDILSFNDELGEITLRFNDNFIFDITSTNLLLEFSELARMKSKKTLLGQMLVDGVDKNTYQTIMNNQSINEAYKEINSSMSSSEIIKQLRVNVAISMFYSLPPYVQPFILKGVLNTGAEMINNNIPLREVQERIRYLKEFIDDRNWEEINQTLAKYFQSVLYAPGPDF